MGQQYTQAIQHQCTTMPIRSKPHGHVRPRLLRSNLATLLLLTVLFLHLSWMYDALKRRARQQPLNSTSVHAAGQRGQESFTATSTETALFQQRVVASNPQSSSKQQVGLLSGATVRLVGEQLTHSVAAGSLFSWGLDDSYRLGRTAGDSSVPQLTLPSLQVMSVAASRHSLFVTADGALFSMGPNNSAGGGGYGSKSVEASGQLGRQGSQAPAVVAVKRAVQVASGRYHSVAVTSDGSVYTWGLNDWGQLGRQVQGNHAFNAAEPGGSADANRLYAHVGIAGSSCSHGWLCHTVQPGRVDLLSGVKVVAVAAGRYSTLAIDDTGQVWTWGYDGCAHGQLPLQQDAWQPRHVAGQLQGKKMVAVDVGYTFWLAATSDGELYTCDNMDDGYAGTLDEKRAPNNAGQLGRSGEPYMPGRVESLGSIRVVAVAAGREHAVVATSSGQVITFGGTAAVLGRQGPHHVPGVVGGALAGQFVKHVAAGEYFSLAGTDSKLFAWGSNAYVCLGNGDRTKTELLTPAAVSGPLGSGSWQLHGIAAGYQHAFAIAHTEVKGELAKLKGASKAAAVKVGNTGVEVVLTEQQLQQRQQYQQQQNRYAPVLQQLLGTTTAQSGGTRSTDLKAVTQRAAVAAATAGVVLQDSESSSFSRSNTTLSLDSSGNTSNGLGSSEWHTSYLPKHFPKLPLPRDTWASWTPSPWRTQLEHLSGDVFKLLPKEYNSMHRNPCWGGTGPQLSCLPFFNILGVSKSGTTDLYHRLTMHKQILPATNKGPHFWDECPYPSTGPCTAAPSGDFQAYINLFSRAADLIRSRPNAITGEASSNTFTSANGVYLRGFKGHKTWSAWAGDAGVNASMPALLREAQPYLRLIVLLRNPVDRYYSAFNYYRWWKANEPKATADDFHSTAMTDVQQWQACAAAVGTAECVRRYEPQQLVKGMYAEFMQDWLRHFPREQLLVLRYEDYAVSLREHLNAVLQFLEVQDTDAAVLTAMSSAAVENNQTYPPMRQDTRAMLQQFYAPFNQALDQVLNGDSRWLWRDAEPLEHQ